jgi:hypothetical protein
MTMRPKRQLHRRVQAVLLDDEELHAGIAAGAHHGHAVVPLGGHGLFAQYMAAGGGHANGLQRVQAAGRGEHDDVGVAACQQRVQRIEAWRAGAGHRGLQRGRVRVAHRHQFGPGCVLLQGVEVVARDAAATHQREANRAVGDEFGSRHRVWKKSRGF